MDLGRHSAIALSSGQPVLPVPAHFGGFEGPSARERKQGTRETPTPEGAILLPPVLLQLQDHTHAQVVEHSKKRNKERAKRRLAVNILFEKKNF